MIIITIIGGTTIVMIGSLASDLSDVVGDIYPPYRKKILKQCRIGALILLLCFILIYRLSPSKPETVAVLATAMAFLFISWDTLAYAILEKDIEEIERKNHHKEPDWFKREMANPNYVRRDANDIEQVVCDLDERLAGARRSAAALSQRPDALAEAEARIRGEMALLRAFGERSDFAKMRSNSAKAAPSTQGIYREAYERQAGNFLEAAGEIGRHIDAYERQVAELRVGALEEGFHIDLAEAKGMIGAPGHDMDLDETAKAFLAAVDAAQAA